MVTSIIQVVLVIMFAISVAMKFLRTKNMVQHWNEYRYPFWFMYVIATLEGIGALGMLGGFVYPQLLNYAAALLAVLMAGAIHAHLFRARHKPYMASNALLMLGLCIVLIAM
ncbi:DoxX family protein [Brevibacillus dissolubilis]|uniref:DoxX family protein n=1 Tax=Brevibacillus dissolubilis TaxID=1844116 RepID=UPI001115FD90|nr:DoxX family protein [Brevibacillus dissolubilis]